MSSDRSREPAPVSGDDFRQACGRFATGVAIASAVDAAGTPHGLTVSSFTSVSLDPPLILICLGHAVTSIEVFRGARYFAVNVLAEEQRDIADRFARKGFDRFDGLKWSAGASGAPLLAGALATMECVVRQRVAAGDHDILVGEMVGAHAADGAPLIYFSSRFRSLA